MSALRSSNSEMKSSVGSVTLNNEKIYPTDTVADMWEHINMKMSTRCTCAGDVNQLLTGAKSTGGTAWWFQHAWRCSFKAAFYSLHFSTLLSQTEEPQTCTHLSYYFKYPVLPKTNRCRKTCFAPWVSVSLMLQTKYSIWCINKYNLVVLWKTAELLQKEVETSDFGNAL